MPFYERDPVRILRNASPGQSSGPQSGSSSSWVSASAAR